MKPIAAFCLALFGTTTLAAQTPMTQVIPPRGAASMEGVGTVTTYNSETHQTTTVVVQVPQAASCPVSVRAQQFSAAANMMEADSNRPKGMAQSLHLALAKPNSDRITKATVRVRGLTPRPRATLTTMTLGGDPSDAIRTVEVTFPADSVQPGSDKSASADVWVPGMSAVYSIELVSVTYADGSTWNSTAGKSCRTPIDGVMLVGAR